VFIIEQYFTLKSLLLFMKHVTNACPDKEVWNKKRIHGLVAKFQNAGSVCDRKR
jgi:hypothetical protein